MTSGFDKAGSFYKGNIHTHSTRSDGGKTVEQVVEGYRSRGYDFLSITDHFLPAAHFGRPDEGFITVTDTSAFSDDTFLTIPGAEVHAPALSTGDLWHFVAVGLPMDFAELQPEETGLDIAKRSWETGAFMSLAHPAWYSLSLADALPMVPYMHSIEVWNWECDMIRRADSWHFADAAYSQNVRLSVNAADDAHFKSPFSEWHDAFGGYVMVKSESLSTESILTAMKAGDFYASTGATIEDIAFDGDVLKVKTEPALGYLVSGPDARFARAYGPDLTEAGFVLKKPDGTPEQWASGNYVRLSVLNMQGHIAWSQPIWLNED